MRMYNVPTKFGACINIANFQAKPPSTVIRYVCILVLIQFLERFQIDAFSMKTISVLVGWRGLNASKFFAFQNENAVV